MGYTDSSGAGANGEIRLGFLINVYQDDRYAWRLIQQIRSFYPREPIIAISDGTDPSGMADFAEQMDVTYIPTDKRLKLLDTGGQWLERWMSAALEMSVDYIFRIDPDSWLWRPFKSLPQGDIAGMLVEAPTEGHDIIRGGCAVYKSATLRRILDAELTLRSRNGEAISTTLLRDPCYQHPRYSYPRYSDRLKFSDEDSSNEHVFAEDFCVGHIAKRMGLRLEQWDEVAIAFREGAPDNSDLRWAVTHPQRFSLTPL